MAVSAAPVVVLINKPAVVSVAVVSVLESFEVVGTKNNVELLVETG